MTDCQLTRLIRHFTDNSHFSMDSIVLFRPVLCQGGETSGGVGYPIPQLIKGVDVFHAIFLAGHISLRKFIQ